MKSKIIAWKVFIIIIKIINSVMRCDAIELIISLDSDQVLLKDLAMIMLKIMSTRWQIPSTS